MKKMKKIAMGILGTFAVILMFLTPAIAQNNSPLRRVEVGVRFLPTYTSLDLRTSNGDVVYGSTNMKRGFGVNLGLNLTSHLGLQGEINYNQVSQSYKDVAVSREVTVRYLNVPLLLSLNTNKTSRINLNFVAGPQFGFNVGTSMNTIGTENIAYRGIVSVKKGDVGFAYGAGLEFALNVNHTIRLDLGYRGFYGLVDMKASTSDTNTYNVIVKSTRHSNGGYVGLSFLF